MYGLRDLFFNGVVMSYSSYTVAKTVCSLAKGQVTNLQLHKLLYLMHLHYLGRTGKLLIDEAFEAWKYGPVLPKVYERVFIFGTDFIKRDMFYNHSTIPEEDEQAYEVIRYILSKLLFKKPSHLVTLTHPKDGAWKKNYGVNAKNTIPTADIRMEYERVYKR